MPFALRSETPVGRADVERFGSETRPMKTLDCNQDAMAPFSPSNCSAFRVIVADPPWDYPEGFATQSRSPGKWSGPIDTKLRPYPSMTLEAIRALPVREMAAPDCRLWLWTTNRYLPAAFGVMEAWGFEYRQTLVWHKSDGNMGGSVAPNSAEFLLVGVRGNPPCVKRLPAAVVKLPQSKKHSKKPGEWQWLIEQTDEGPRLEMFARRKRHGWASWGNKDANDVEMPNDKLCVGGTQDYEKH